MLELVHRIKNMIERDNKKFYVSCIERIKPTNLRRGVTLLTPLGLGIVTGTWPSSWMGKKPTHVSVLLNRKYPKSFRIEDVQQFAVKHKPSQRRVLLSSHHYEYIGTKKQIIRYRLTHRNYAYLSDSCLEENRPYYLYNHRRGGFSILKALQNEDYYTIKGNLLQVLFNK